MRKLFSAALAAVFFFSSTFAHADISDEIAELKSMMIEMQSRLERLERENQTLRGQMTAPSLPDTATSSASRQWDNAMNKFNPSISVIGDTTYQWSDGATGVQDTSEFTFRELELAFSANVDTYARGDVFLAVENEGGTTEVNLEEAYLTWLEPPLDGAQAKVGKFRPAFGKANRVHLHSLTWVDYPKVVQEYFGEEGFSREGISASYLLPLDAFYSELTAEVTNDGVSGNNDFAYLGHWKNFFDLNDELSLEFGGSFMSAENGQEESGRTETTGADMTLKWTNPTADKKLTWQSEILNSKAEVFGSDDTDGWGTYSSLDYGWSKRWSIFGRYDFWQEAADSSMETDSYSTGLTFAQSEYAFWRIQYTHDDPDFSEANDTVWLQLNFGMGPHRAHTY